MEKPTALRTGRATYPFNEDEMATLSLGYSVEPRAFGYLKSFTRNSLKGILYDLATKCPEPTQFPWPVGENEAQNHLTFAQSIVQSKRLPQMEHSLDLLTASALLDRGCDQLLLSTSFAGSDDFLKAMIPGYLAALIVQGKISDAFQTIRLFGVIHKLADASNLQQVNLPGLSDHFMSIRLIRGMWSFFREFSIPTRPLLCETVRIDQPRMTRVLSDLGLTEFLPPAKWRNQFYSERRYRLKSSRDVLSKFRRKSSRATLERHGHPCFNSCTGRGRKSGMCRNGDRPCRGLFLPRLERPEVRGS